MREEETYFITEGILQVEQIPFQEINTLEMNGQVNDHGSLWIHGKVPESKEKQLTFLIPNRTEIVLKTTQEMVLFRGILKELDVEYSDGQIIVDVKVLSHTCLLDGKKKKRPFHNANTTVKDIIRTVSCDTKNSDVMIGDECVCEVGSFLMQYEETDWEFLKRVASLAGQTLIPDTTVAYPAFYAGKPKEIVSREILEPDAYSMIYDGGNMYRIKSRRDWMRLGDKVRFHGVELYVRKVSITLQQAVLCGTYDLCFRNGMNTEKKENKFLTGKNIEGIVQKISRDQVLVNIKAADGNDNGEACWFPYSTVYASADGSGWYCMPEIGDYVRIQFSDSFEGNAYAASSISRYKPNQIENDLMKDYTRRYIRNKQGMEIQWTPEYVRISANGAGVAEINKSGTVSLLAGNRMKIHAVQDVSICAGRDVRIKGGKGISISCGAKAELNMDDNGVIELKGNEIYTN